MIKDMFPEILKACSRCKQQYPTTEFRRWEGICKPCQAKGMREYRIANYERVRAIEKRREAKLTRDDHRNFRLKSVYGITLAQYNILLESQNGRCAICKTDQPNGKDKVFHVDHDHATNRVRGLLCNFCNSGLGYFKEKKETFLNAIKYLEKGGD